MKTELKNTWALCKARMTNVIEKNHLRGLKKNDKDVCGLIKEFTSMELKQCAADFPRYANTIETSAKLLNELCKEDVAATLLLACTQMGKTSTVFWTAYNLMTHADPKYFVPYTFVFIITGINSNSWKEQTQERVLPSMAKNVWHNQDIRKRANVNRLREAVMSNHNTLIVIDEVHVGTKLNNVIFNTLREFHPDNEDREVTQSDLFEFLHLKKVKFLLVSATPDAIKETMEQNWDTKKCRTVIAHPDSVPTYVWHKHFLEQGRVHQAHGMNDRDENGRMFHRAIIRKISEYTEPKYHMIRFPMDTKSANIEKSIELVKKSICKLNVNAYVVKWDAEHTIKGFFESKNFKVFADRNIAMDAIMGMTNEEILRQKPKKHIIFIIKELFRVAQTMPINHVGLLVDRDTKNPCDTTLSQSLIGRACGHNKAQFMDQIQIYTNKDSVINYVNLWKNGFDYSKVPEYKGNGLKTNKSGTKLRSEATMMGDLVVRDADLVVRDEGADEVDTQQRLQNVMNTYMKQNTIVHNMINMFVANKFEPLYEEDLCKSSKTGKLSISNYTTWNDEHSQFKIIEKSSNGRWILRDVIKKQLNVA